MPKSKSKPLMSARTVLTILENRMWRAPAHAILREVRNATGFAQTRTADALVISLWPSRGVWFAGVEVKVHRNDWLRELKEPKSDDIQKFCDYWYIATPKGLVREGELPPTWGLVELDGQRHRVVKAAPKLKPLPLRAEFVAAVLRNRAEYEADQGKRILDDLRRQEVDAGTRAPAQIDLELQLARGDADTAKRELEKLRQQVAAFEHDAGVRIADPWQGNLGKAFAVARRLTEHRNDLNSVANDLEGFATDLRELHQTLAEGKGETPHEQQQTG